MGTHARPARQLVAGHAVDDELGVQKEYQRVRAWLRGTRSGAAFEYLVVSLGHLRRLWTKRSLGSGDGSGKTCGHGIDVGNSGFDGGRLIDLTLNRSKLGIDLRNT